METLRTAVLLMPSEWYSFYTARTNSVAYRGSLFLNTLQDEKIFHINHNMSNEVKCGYCLIPHKKLHIQNTYTEKKNFIY